MLSGGSVTSMYTSTMHSTPKYLLSLAVPCDAGYYLASRENVTCTPCPVGTYQDDQGQISCKSCLPGSTTLTEGSDSPIMCSVRAQRVRIPENDETPPESLIDLNEDMSEEEAEEILNVL